MYAPDCCFLAASALPLRSTTCRCPLPHMPQLLSLFATLINHAARLRPVHRHPQDAAVSGKTPLQRQLHTRDSHVYIHSMHCASDATGAAHW
jgi:hypothetical protein